MLSVFRKLAFGCLVTLVFLLPFNLSNIINSCFCADVQENANVSSVVKGNFIFSNANALLQQYDSMYTVDSALSAHKDFLYPDVERVSLKKLEDSIYASNGLLELNTYLESSRDRDFKWTSSCEQDTKITLVGFVYKQHYTRYVSRFESVLAAGGYKKGTLYEGESTLENIKTLIDNVFVGWGYYNSTISVSAEYPVRKDRVVIVIDVKSLGERKYINKINFTGNKVESTFSLKFAISYMEACLWGHFTEASMYCRTIKKDIQRELLTYYKDNGYLKSKIKIKLVHYTDEVIGEVVDVNITIDEGLCYKINTVITQCEEEHSIKYRDIVQNIANKLVFKGEVYCHKYVKRTSSNISDYFKSCGFLNVKVYLFLDYLDTDSDNYVDIKYVVTVGKRVKVRKINFVGNYFTQDYVLRRCCTQQESDWINPAKLDLAKDIMLNHKFGTSVRIKKSGLMKATETYDFIDITYVLREIEQTVVAWTSTTDLNTYEMSSIADCRFKNLLGTGQNLNLYVIRTASLSSYYFDYINTRFENNRIGIGVRGTWRVGHDSFKINKIMGNYKYAWFEDSKGCDMYLCYFLNRYHRFHVGIGGKDTRLFNNIELAPYELNDYLNKYYGKSTTNDYYVFAGSSYSSIDNPVWPNNGCVQQLEFHVTIPPTRPMNYFRFDYYINKFLELDNSENSGYILNLHGRLGFVDTYGMYDAVGNSVPYPFFRNLQCDSSSWVRGLQLGSGGAVINNEISGSTKHELYCGSNFAACLKTNLYIKSKYFRSFDHIIRPGLYIDIGTMFNTNDFLIKLQRADVVPHRIGAGVTAVFKSPVIGAPIEFSVGRILNKQVTDNLEGDFFGFIFTVTVANCSL